MIEAASCSLHCVVWFAAFAVNPNIHFAMLVSSMCVQLDYSLPMLHSVRGSYVLATYKSVSHCGSMVFAHAGLASYITAPRHGAVTKYLATRAEHGQ